MDFWKAGYTQTQIAKEVGVHQSTISRELNQNITFVRTKLGSWQYNLIMLKATPYIGIVGKKAY